MHLPWVARVWIFIGFSAAVLFVKLIIQAIVPDVSEEVDIQLRRQDVVIDKIFLNIGDDDMAEEEHRSTVIKTEYTIRITDDDPL